MSASDFDPLMRNTADSITLKLQEIKKEIERLTKQRDQLTVMHWSYLEQVRYLLGDIGRPHPDLPKTLETVRQHNQRILQERTLPKEPQHPTGVACQNAAMNCRTGMNPAWLGSMR